MATFKSVQMFLLALSAVVLLGNAAGAEISASTEAAKETVTEAGTTMKPCEPLAESPCKLDELSELCKAYKERCGKMAAPDSVPSKKPGKLKKPNKPAAGKPQKPAAGKPQKPGGKPQKPGGKPQKPGGKPQKPGGKPQKPAGKPQKPGGKPQKPGGKPQKPAGKPQKPAGKPQKPGAKPQKPSNDKPVRPYGCVGSGQTCNCDCCPGLYCVEGAVPATGRTCMRQSEPPGECKKEKPRPATPGLDNSGGGQISQGAGSIPVVGPNLQQGAEQGTATATAQGSGQGGQTNPVSSNTVPANTVPVG